MKYARKNNSGLKINKLVMAAGLCALMSVNVAQAYTGDVFSDNGYAAHMIDSDGAAVVKDVTTIDGRAVDAQIKMGAGKNNYNLRWSQFNVPKNKTIDYEFSKAGQVALNKVEGGGLSKIGGSITSSGANGRVILSNSNGIIVENGASINVNGSMMLTTHDASINNSGKVTLTKKTGDNSKYNGVVVRNADIDLGKDFVVASTGIKVEGADIFAGGSVSFVTSDGASFVAKKNKDTFTNRSSDARLTIKPNKVSYNDRVSANEKNSIIVKGSSSAQVAIKTKNGGLYLVANGDDSKITTSHLEYTLEDTNLINKAPLVLRADDMDIQTTSTNSKVVLRGKNKISLWKVGAKTIETDKNVVPASFSANYVNADSIKLNGNSFDNAANATVVNSNLKEFRSTLKGIDVNLQNNNIEKKVVIDKADSVYVNKLYKSGGVGRLNQFVANNISGDVKLNNADVKNVQIVTPEKVYVSNLSAYQVYIKGTNTKQAIISGDSQINKITSQAASNHFRDSSFGTVNMNPSLGGSAYLTNVSGLGTKNRIIVNNKVGIFDSISVRVKEGSGSSLVVGQLDTRKNLTLSSDSDLIMMNNKSLYARDGQISVSAKGNIQLSDVRAGKSVSIKGDNITSNRRNTAVTAESGSVTLVAQNKLDVKNIHSARDINATGLKSVKVKDSHTHNYNGDYGQGYVNFVTEDANNINYSNVDAKFKTTIQEPTPVDPAPVDPSPIEPPEPILPTPGAVSPGIPTIAELEKNDFSAEVQKLVPFAVLDTFKPTSLVETFKQNLKSFAASDRQGNPLGLLSNIIKTDKGFRILK